MPLDWNLNDTHQGIVRLHRDVAQLRRNWNNDTRGLTGTGLQVFHANQDMSVMAWHRWYEHGVGDDVVVVANLSGEARGGYRIGLPAGGHWELKFNSDSTDYSPNFGSMATYDLTTTEDDQDGFAFSGTVDLAPYTVLIYSWKG